MQKPVLDQMWETFIKFSWDDISSGIYFNLTRKQINPVITRLKNEGISDWYCFLIHDKDNGVPTTQDDVNPYFHIMFSLKKNLDPKEFLPDFCVMTRKMDINSASVIFMGGGVKFNTSLLKDESIEEVWRIIGEQSEQILSILNSFKESINIPVFHVGQLLHYYASMTQLRVG